MEKMFWIRFVRLSVYCVLLSLFFLFFYPASQVIADSQDDTKKISVVYCVDSIPFHYTNPDGQAEGLLIDFWRLWSKKTGIAIDFVPAAWGDTLKMMREGKADAHAGLFCNDERAQYLDYSITLRKTDTHIFYDKRLPSPESNQDFVPYRTGVLRGDFVEGYLSDTSPGMQLSAFDSYEDIMAALKRKELFVFAADTPTALFHLQRSGLKSSFTYKPNMPLYQNDWYAAVAKGDTGLLKVINKGFEAFSEEEKRNISRQWASGTKKKDTGELIIAVSTGYAPFSFIGPDGNPAGLLVDIWRMWSRVTKTPIVFKAGSWAETLEAVRTREADIHSGLFKNREREKWLSFSLPIFESESASYFLSSSEEPIILSNLKGEPVGAMTGSYQERFLRENFPEIKTLKRTDNEALILSLIKGDITAFVHETPAVSADLARLGLTGLVTRGETLFSNRIYAGVTKGREELLEKINDGFLMIPIDELAAMETRWLPNAPKKFYREQTANIGLTHSEKKWIRANPQIRVAATPNWPPFEFREKDEYSGLHADMIRLAASKAGLEVEPIFGKCSDLVAQLKDGTLDLCPGLNATEERKKYLVFTDDWVSKSSQVIVAPATTPIGSIMELYGRTVAVKKGCATETLLKNNYPDINLLLVGNTLEALKTLITGNADAYLGNQAVVSYLIKKNSFSGLKVTAFFEEARKSEYRIGVIDEKPVLRDIFQKALTAITTQEISALQEKWFGMTMIRQKAGPDLKLTDEEKSWLNDHPVIRVGADRYPPFEIVNEKGNYNGIIPDYLKLIGGRLGIEFKPLLELTWAQVLSGTKDGTVDMAPGLNDTPERREFLAFTRTYLSTPMVIFTKDDFPSISGLADLADKSLSIPSGYSEIEIFKKQFPSIKIVEVESLIDALTAVATGKVEATVANLAVGDYLIQTHHLVNLKIAAQAETSGSKLAMGVRKDWPELARILDKAIESITQDEHQKIQSAWMEILKTKIELTDEERSWLAEHPVIRVAMDPDWAPVEFADDKGNFHGISMDYLQQLSKLLKIRFEVADGLTWQDKLIAMENGKFDLFSSISQTRDREARYNFTTPYLSMPINIFASDDGTYIGKLKTLEGKQVAVVEGYAIHEWVQGEYPGINLVPAKSVPAALKMLTEGKVSAFVGNVVTTSYYISKLRLNQIRLVGETPYKNIQSMAIRQDWPILAKILQKGLDAISQNEREAIFNRWVSIKYEHGFDYSLLWKVLVPAFLVVMLFFYWNRRLSKEVTERKMVEKALGKSEVKYRELVENANSIIIKLDILGNITFFNEFAQNFFGFSPDEVIGQNIIGTIVSEQDVDGHDLAMHIQNIINDPEAHENNDNENIRKNGERVWISWTNKAIFSEKDDTLKELMCIGTDITKRRTAEKQRDDAFHVIRSSIDYASRIQRSVLPPPSELLKMMVKEYFVLWKPRDVVGGDIYWCREWGQGTLVILADCTGHGVPGAFMTLISSGALDLGIPDVPVGDPAALIRRMHQLIQTVLGQDSDTGQSDDGLELGLCYIHPHRDRITFAGAGFPLFKLNGEKVEIIKGNKIGIGYRYIAFDSTWMNRDIEVLDGDSFYMSSDGIFDQIGGPKRMGFGKKRFRKLLTSIQDIPINGQGEKIYQEFEKYQGKEKRRDDVSAIGFKLCHFGKPG